MTTRYQKRHYEDVAHILLAWEVGAHLSRGLVHAFADLFAADNPRRCVCCQAPDGAIPPCIATEGRGVSFTVDREHDFTGGFNRDQFLTACGLESADTCPDCGRVGMGKHVEKLES